MGIQMTKSIYGKGHELLSLFDVEYHVFSENITNVLMSNPNKRFRLSVSEAPTKKKEKSQ